MLLTFCETARIFAVFMDPKDGGIEATKELKDAHAPMRSSFAEIRTCSPSDWYMESRNGRMNRANSVSMTNVDELSPEAPLGRLIFGGDQDFKS